MEDGDDVLFQKIGNMWYIFTQIKDDIFYSALPEGVGPRTTDLEIYEVIEKHKEDAVKSYDRKKLDLAS